jgi:hypothetical protein
LENYLSIVSSRGILRSCDIHSNRPRSTNPIFEFEPASLYHGGSIYVCTDALEHFAAQMLPQLRVPFTLVSGDSDRPVDNALLTNNWILPLIESPLLIRWYAQNLLASHPKMFHLPIGLDYHTAWERPSLFEHEKISPFSQELSLINTLVQSGEIQQRQIKAYCNWALTANRGDRQECLQKIDKSSCFIESQRIARHISWTRQAVFAFVLSPSGEGADCHRTWEAIMTGSIPIVKAGMLAPVFDDLPVVQVEDWSIVTSGWLNKIFEECQEKKYDFSRMFLGYWQKRIRGLDPVNLPQMTMKEFREFITSKK